MKISFGTKIILQDNVKQLNEVNGKFKDPVYKKKINIPMSEAWTVIDTLPKMEMTYAEKQTHKLHRNNNLTKGKYEITAKPVYGTTSSIDICSAGVVIGNNGEVAMFHIAPTIENYDSLSLAKGWERDYMGKSIDKFEKSSGGIKSAIIIGGKKSGSVREELSKKTYNLIKEKFTKRNIPVSSLSDLNFKKCDLFYSSQDDTLKIGVLGLDNVKGDAFGEVKLADGDSFEVK